MPTGRTVWFPRIARGKRHGRRFPGDESGYASRDIRLGAGAALDTGVYVAAIGGALMVVSALVPSGWHTWRQGEHTRRRVPNREQDVDR